MSSGQAMTSSERAHHAAERFPMKAWRASVLLKATMILLKVKTSADLPQNYEQEDAYNRTAELEQDAAKALIRASDLFDETYYLSRNEDVAASGIDPLRHFVMYGGQEGRLPSTRFDSSRYLDCNKDVKESGMNPLIHYIIYGSIEGRGPGITLFESDPSIVSCVTEYLSQLESLAGLGEMSSHAASTHTIAVASLKELLADAVEGAQDAKAHQTMWEAFPQLQLQLYASNSVRHRLIEQNSSNEEALGQRDAALSIVLDENRSLKSEIGDLREELRAFDLSDRFDLDIDEIKSAFGTFDPLKRRILFVGYCESPHTHSWIKLLSNTDFEVRLFAMPTAAPPPGFDVRTYVTIPDLRIVGSQPNGGLRHYLRLAGDGWRDLPAALGKVICAWSPHVVHTLGFNYSSFLYSAMRENTSNIPAHKWVAQARGGPDIALHIYSEQYRGKIEKVLATCDHFIADNEQNYIHAKTLGLSDKKATNPGLGAVPGPGGLDLKACREMAGLPPSERPRTIIWPKAYETISSKALPVIEALRLAWDKISPCTVDLLWFGQPDVAIWFQKMLPPEIRSRCRLHGIMDHQEVLKLMSEARVMLAPSLTDGIPNSMIEAMALGAFPIVSPLETITPVVQQETNVLFARNLYPDEIATALVRAMTDDDLVDKASERNFADVYSLADRARIRDAVIAYYQSIIEK